MDYERIHKIKTGISPSKLRMKLLGSPHHKNKNGSNNNSSRTSSPSRSQDSEFGNNSLLAAENGDFGEEVSSSEVLLIKSDDPVSRTSQNDRNFLQPKELTFGEKGTSRIQLFSEVNGRTPSSIYPVTTYEDETIDSGTTPRFEFDKEMKPLQRSLSRSLSRPMSSKWNDAEKWIVNRQFIQSGISKNIHLNDVVSWEQGPNTGIVAPECIGFENEPSGKETFTSGGDLLVDSCAESKDLTDETRSNQRPSGVASVRSVSMRDMGTEMTPIPSQEPSKSNTPIGAATPLRSPNSSIPSTPRRDMPIPTTTEQSFSNATRDVPRNGKIDLSEQEQKLETRREIVALGVQLGKMNIAAWASKVEKEISVCGNVDLFELERIAYATRAAAWEEAEKSKHAARFQQEETRIQAWENQQKAKLEAEMEKLEAQIVQMRAQAQARMVKKITRATQKSEEKRAAAEARRNREAVKTKYQAAHIRRTGQIPSAPAICCGWW